MAQKRSRDDNINDTNNMSPNPKRVKSSCTKPEVPSISLSSSDITSSTSSSALSSSRSSQSSHKRRDLFDPNLDETYRGTNANSTIPPPTLGSGQLEKVWQEKTQKALLTFQRDRKSHGRNQNEPNNIIMRTLLKEATLETDNDVIRGLQDIVLSLVYSSETQQKQLMRSKNRRKSYNNQPRTTRYDISWYEKLPGPQPHSITRQNLDRLRSYYYWVTEKSDGIRFMLLLSNSPIFNAYLVDRKFEFYRINDVFYKQFLKLLTFINSLVAICTFCSFSVM